jgi:hypothetical protein
MKNATSNRSSTNHDPQPDYTPTKGPTKIEECLILLLTRHETNTHDAGRAYNETCLHTEVSSLQKDHGIMAKARSTGHPAILFTKIGKSVRYDPVAVGQWLAKNTRNNVGI